MNRLIYTRIDRQLFAAQSEAFRRRQPFCFIATRQCARLATPPDNAAGREGVNRG